MNIEPRKRFEASAVARRAMADGSVFNGDTLERNVPFHETNPFCFRVLFGVSHLFTETYAVCSGVCKWVRSGKTNPFWGVFWGRFRQRFHGPGPVAARTSR